MPEVTELFAIEAEQLYFSDFFDEALELCTSGIEKYPDYPLAYSILAKIFQGKNDNSSALSVLEIAEEKFPFSKSLKFQKQEILDLLNDNEQSSQNEQSSSLPFLKYVQNFEYSEEDESYLRASNLKLIPGLEFTPLQANFSLSRKQRLIQPLPALPPFSFEIKNEYSLIEEIDNTIEAKRTAVKAKGLPKVNDTAKTKQEPDFLIVTETLARILESQGAFDAAVKAYSELIKTEPSKSDYFLKRIEEIKLQMKK